MTSSKRLGVYAAVAVLVTATGVTTGLVTGTTSSHSSSASTDTPSVRTAKPTRLVGSSPCTGPVGTAFIALPGYQAFDGINTANCDYVQNYNVDDVSQSYQFNGTTYSDGTNYDGSDPGIALSGNTLWFAISATDSVAAINTTLLTEKNYNPTETVIPVGLMPQQLAVTPDGSQVWVAESGPETLTTHVYGISIISTATDKVIGHVRLGAAPTDVAFSPDGSKAYVTTSHGLDVFEVTTRSVVGLVPGLGSPQSVAVSPDGKYVYVTETDAGRLATISTSSDNVVRTTTVGDEPWQAAVTSDGSEVYVANPDSDSVSVVDAATGAVKNTITVPGNPDALALTPDGSELWVTGNDSGIVYIFDAGTGTVVGQTNLGGDGANSGDGMDPSGIVIATTTISGS